MAMRRRKSADQLRLSDTEIVADFERVNKVILPIWNAFMFISFRHLPYTLFGFLWDSATRFDRA